MHDTPDAYEYNTFVVSLIRAGRIWRFLRPRELSGARIKSGVDVASSRGVLMSYESCGSRLTGDTAWKMVLLEPEEPHRTRSCGYFQTAHIWRYSPPNSPGG